jgi:phenylacetate-coenzyme A ligase PaaK-like adenylate-forming protein
MNSQVGFKLKILWYFLQYTLRGAFRNRAKLERFQQRKWRKFRRRVLAHSPFYQQLAIDNVALNAFPIINKAGFMANFDAINTLGLKQAVR